MITRSTLPAMSVVVFLGFIGQAPARGADGNVAPHSPTYIVRSVGGIVYYYDLAGNPLFYDDFMHYAYPHRFSYQHGGWVLVTHRYSDCSYRAGAAHVVPAARGYRSGGQVLQQPASPRHVATRTAGQAHQRPARLRAR